jgi:hypothetical protein
MPASNEVLMFSPNDKLFQRYAAPDWARAE